MIGIYKITSPTNRVYIGQSVNIEHRWYMYSFLNCKSQPKLYNSFLKHGFEKHKLVILEECDEPMLNERERYWQEYYDCVEKGMNCSYVGTQYRKQKHSKESREKMSNIRGEKHPHWGRKWSDEVNAKKGRKGELSYWYGKKLSKESTRKRQLKRSNKVKIIENGVETIFECVMDCAVYLKCTTKNVLYRDKCRRENRKSIGRYKDIYIEILK